MLETGVLVTSLLLQGAAAYLALRLSRVTGRRTGWLLIAAAILLMGLRRALTLVNHQLDPLANPIILQPELVALAISALMVTGLAWVNPLFASMAEAQSSLRKRERQQAAIANLGRHALAGADLDHLFEECVNSVAEALDVELVKVLELRGDQSLLLRAGVGWREGLAGCAVVPGGAESQAGHTLASHQPVIVEELRTERRFSGPPLLVEHGVVSGVSVRIGADERPFGVLGAHTREIRKFSDDDVSFLEAVANVLADAIERSIEEERLRRIVDSSPIAMAIVDSASRIVLANDKAGQLLGYAVDEIIGRSLDEVTADWDPIREDGTAVPPEQYAVNVTLRTGKPYTAIAGIRRKGGARVWIQAQTAPLGDPGELEEHAAVITMVDITERRKLEGRIRQSQKMEAVGRLAGGIAHDFNNLLTVISGLTEMGLERPGLDASLVHDLELVQKAGEEAAELTNRLLAFSRQQMMRPKVLDLNALIAEFEKLLKRTLEENIEIRLELDPDLGGVRADAGQIHQVLLNLALNARDAMAAGGALTVATRNVELDEAFAPDVVVVEPGSYVEIAVTDTGTGMDEATRARAFEPFFTTKAEEGTGLGLATVYGIVKQSHGYVWLTSEPGTGTTVKVHLPRVTATHRSETAGAVAPEVPAGSETVLVVEDKDSVRALAVRILERRGYRVLTAENPQQAMEVAERNEGAIDLLVVDLVLPGGSGIEVADRLQARQPGMKTLYMSGYAPKDLFIGGKLDSEKHFLPKPFKASVLAAKVREVLEQPNPV